MSLSWPRLFCVLCALVLTACAGGPRESFVYDPYEPTNRAVFRFNDGFDRALAEPVTKAYTTITPRPVRRRLHDFTDHLRTPVWFVNDVLQGDLHDAGHQMARFAINTVFGLGGLWDVASERTDLAKEPEDFGQTLAVWGVPEGPYLVLPVYGPSTMRDAPGRAVDILFAPLTWMQFDGDVALAAGRRVAGALETRARGESTLLRVRRSPDPYVAMRSIYLQNRRGAIRQEDDPFADLPEFE